MKPLSSCALFGAVRALGGIKDALILQHSVVGCQWGSLAITESALNFVPL
jgi:nitrogenase molybdenum-iron protein beta chain